MSLRIGETFIYGLSREQTRQAIEACANLGIDSGVVRTTDSGLIVPNAVADEIERMGLPHWAESEVAVF